MQANERPLAVMTTRLNGAARDDAVTVLAIGVLAYCLETMLHEGVGHGGLCLAQGHHITLLTPLWMRCDVVTPIMVFAGPAANLIAALTSFAMLRVGWLRGSRLRLFVWLCLAFNGLVGTGYPIVGGATGFGDWPYLFRSIQPAWVWRISLAVIGLCCYLLVLKATMSSYVMSLGGGRATFVRRLALASTGAGTVALAAQVYGQGGGLLGLVLPAACTFGVGGSLFLLRDNVAIAGDPLSTATRSAPIVVLGCIVAAIYILLIGRGVL